MSISSLARDSRAFAAWAHRETTETRAANCRGQETVRHDAPLLSPEGTLENSPPVHWWERSREKGLVPKGRLMESREPAVQPSLRDYLNSCGSVPSVETLGYPQSSLRD